MEWIGLRWTIFVSLFLSSLWGNLGDKYGRKLMMIRATFGLAIAQIIIGFSQDINQLFIGRLLQGGLSGFLPAAMALIASNTPEEKLVTHLVFCSHQPQLEQYWVRYLVVSFQIFYRFVLCF